MARILLYHGVTVGNHVDLNSRNLPLDEFRRHLDWLACNAVVLPLEQFLAGERATDRPTVALTFDDGLVNGLVTVLPELQARDLPATFFVSAIGAVGGAILWPDALDLVRKYGPRELTFDDRRYRLCRRGRFRADDGTDLAVWATECAPADAVRLGEHLRLEVDQRLDLADVAEIWRPMTEKQLAHLTATPLVTLGAHGVTHVALDGRRPKEICDEVEEGRTWLEQVTGRVVDLFAWPFGRYDREGIRLVREAGFRHQLLVDPHFAHDIEAPDLHPRFVINPHVAWPVAIHAILRGSW